MPCDQKHRSFLLFRRDCVLCGDTFATYVLRNNLIRAVPSIIGCIIYALELCLGGVRAQRRGRALGARETIHI